jgi:hypothetical protein
MAMAAAQPERILVRRIPVPLSFAEKALIGLTWRLSARAYFKILDFLSSDLNCD